MLIIDMVVKTRLDRIFMKPHTSCQNCHSPRRPIKECSLCEPCFTWQRRIDRYVAKMERAMRDPGAYYVKYDAQSLPLRIDMAKRSLEEFRWREKGLQTDSTDEYHVEALVNILAQVSRSSFPLDTNRLIYKMTPQSRRLIYEILLAVVENIPARDPILHDGWGRWFHERCFSKEGDAQRKLGHELQQAYWDCIRSGKVPAPNQQTQPGEWLTWQALAPKHLKGQS